MRFEWRESYWLRNKKPQFHREPYHDCTKSHNVKKHHNCMESYICPESHICLELDWLRKWYLDGESLIGLEIKSHNSIEPYHNCTKSHDVEKYHNCMVSYICPESHNCLKLDWLRKWDLDGESLIGSEIKSHNSINSHITIVRKAIMSKSVTIAWRAIFVQRATTV